MPILTRLERHLMGITRFLSYAGRLVLVNSVYSAMPTFYLCTLKLPSEIIYQIDKYRKHVLWHGGDLTKKGVILCLGSGPAEVRRMVAWGSLI
jgi:hypothetical protein